MVLNYLGPDDGQGIKISVNGKSANESYYQALETTVPSGDGRVAVGRYQIADNDFYADIDVDELLFFNEALTDVEITQIRNMS